MGAMSDDLQGRYESSRETYSVKVAGRWTTVRMETELMDALKGVALAESATIAEICTRIARERRQGSLTSALRLYVLNHYRRRASRQAGLGPSSELARELDGFRRSLLATDERHYVLRHDLDLERAADAEPGIAFLLIYRTPENAPLRALGDTLYARELKADYSAAKFKGTPVLQRLSVRTAEGALKYQRLILPCTTPDGRIGRLLVGVTPLSRLAPQRPSTRA